MTEKYPGGPKKGQILMSMDIVEQDHVFEQKYFNVNLTQQIPITMVRFEVRVHGLRKL